MRIPKTPTKRARIEIIPMIDAIFFLLVFFMYSSLSMVRMKAVNVALPTNRATAQHLAKAKGAGKAIKAATSPAKLVVTLTTNGDYYVNKQKVPTANLAQVLAGDVAANPGAIIIINPAKTQTTQALIDTIDSIRRVPTRSGEPLQVLIATEPVDTNGIAVRNSTSNATTTSAASTAKAPVNVSR